MADVVRDDSRQVTYPGRKRSKRGVMAFGETPVLWRFVRGHYRTTLNEWDSGSNPLNAWADAWFNEGMPIVWCTDWQNKPARMRLFVNNASVIDASWRVQGYREFDLDLTELI